MEVKGRGYTEQINNHIGTRLFSLVHLNYKETSKSSWQTTQTSKLSTTRSVATYRGGKRRFMPHVMLTSTICRTRTPQQTLCSSGDDTISSFCSLSILTSSHINSSSKLSQRRTRRTNVSGTLSLSSTS